MMSSTTNEDADHALHTNCSHEEKNAAYLDVYFCSGKLVAKDIVQPLTSAMDDFVRGMVLFVAKKTNIPCHCVKLVWPFSVSKYVRVPSGHHIVYVAVQIPKNIMELSMSNDSTCLCCVAPCNTLGETDDWSLNCVECEPCRINLLQH